MRSERICLQCLQKRTFIYNKYIGHSQCSVCSGRDAIHPSKMVGKAMVRLIDKINLIDSILRSKKSFQNKCSGIRKIIRDIVGEKYG